MMITARHTDTMTPATIATLFRLDRHCHPLPSPRPGALVGERLEGGHARLEVSRRARAELDSAAQWLGRAARGEGAQ